LSILEVDDGDDDVAVHRTDGIIVLLADADDIVIVGISATKDCVGYSSNDTDVDCNKDDPAVVVDVDDNTRKDDDEDSSVDAAASMMHRNKRRSRSFVENAKYRYVDVDNEDTVPRRMTTVLRFVPSYCDNSTTTTIVFVSSMIKMMKK